MNNIHTTIVLSFVAFGSACGEVAQEVQDTNLKHKKAAALQKTLSKTSFLIRPLANSRLQDKPDICKQYRISTKDTEMKVQCDDKTQITLMLDGTPTIYPTKDGPLSVNDIIPAGLDHPQSQEPLGASGEGAQFSDQSQTQFT